MNRRPFKDKFYLFLTLYIDQTAPDGITEKMTSSQVVQWLERVTGIQIQPDELERWADEVRERVVFNWDRQKNNAAEVKRLQKENAKLRETINKLAN
ncbi:MAG: hypothetical protein AB2687_00520 [Candidatus Thiodiazotropha taylori]